MTRCKICDSLEADIKDPKTGDMLCFECVDVIQDTIGSEWYLLEEEDIEELLDE